MADKPFSEAVARPYGGAAEVGITSEFMHKSCNEENKMTEFTAATVDQQDRGIHAPVGRPTAIAFGSAQMQEAGVFVGYEQDRYIIVRLPSDFSDIDLKPGQRVHLKYDFAGTAYRYESSVLHYLNKFGLVFLSYPGSVETNSLRKEDRISCRIPATASIQSRPLKGLVTDISRHGCQFCVRIPATFKLQQVSVLEEVSLSLFLNGDEHPEPLKCKVRNTNFDEFKIVLGIEFGQMEQRLAQRLEGYMEKLKVLH
jgi:hypothetical protein